jgi:DNA-binding NtrC family response regulator
VYTILICDDDEDILSALEIYLWQEGYEVIKAANGLEALEAARQNNIHLFITVLVLVGNSPPQQSLYIQWLCFQHLVAICKCCTELVKLNI